jgi:hypothetical protein
MELGRKIRYNPRQALARVRRFFYAAGVLAVTAFGRDLPSLTSAVWSAEMFFLSMCATIPTDTLRMSWYRPEIFHTSLAAWEFRETGDFPSARV